MIVLINQTSIKKPNNILITGYDVRMCENIVQLENEQYQYDITIYTKAEYKEIEEQLAKEKENKLIELETKNTELQQLTDMYGQTLDSIMFDILPNINTTTTV